MARDLHHLDLPQVQAPIARKKHGGGSSVERADVAGHAKKLRADAVSVLEVQKRRTRPPGVNPALIFKLRLDPGGNLTETDLGKFGFDLLAQDGRETLVVFSSDEQLSAFHQRVATYASPSGHKYGEVGAIEALIPIEPGDRIGRRLEAEPLGAGDLNVPIDVELWHPGTAVGALDRVSELRSLVAANGGRLTDHYVGIDLVVCRCRVSFATLGVLLEVDYVREVDRMPEVAIERVQALGAGGNDLPKVLDSPDDATGVLILDSGITAAHPLLGPTLGDAQVFPEEMGVRDGFGAADGDQHLGGHGTSVAGFAAWGQPHLAMQQDPMQPEVTLFSGRVLDARGEYDPDLLVERQLSEAIRYFLEAYPQCRVINVSLGDPRSVYRTGDRQSRLAARIDQIAYELQERNVLFVISSGNYTHDPSDHRDHVKAYPNYLLNAEAALIEPATAALGVTVGGLAPGGAPLRMQQSAGRRAIAATSGFPSPFTRTGFGVDGMIKPDFVEMAGDYAYDPSAPAKLDRSDPGLGMPSANRDFAPPAGQLIRSVHGTSFAAPAIAHQAARLFNRYPDASPNLVRALLADSARLPELRPAPLDAEFDDAQVMRVYGHGRPDINRASFSSRNDVLLYAESQIAPDAFQLFEIPMLPDDFMRLRGHRFISVALAFDPPTRQTRGDSYLGISMQFHLFRNSSRSDVEAAFRDWNAAPAEVSESQLETKLSRIPSRQKVDLSPGSTMRAKGTLQRGVKRISTRAWDYEADTPLILAVSCLRKWAPLELNAQRYAVVLSLKHEDPEADLHAPLRARLQGRARARVR